MVLIYPRALVPVRFNTSSDKLDEGLQSKVSDKGVLQRFYTGWRVAANMYQQRFHGVHEVMDVHTLTNRSRFVLRNVESRIVVNSRAVAVGSLA
ncbi:hypothetical protein Trco_004973 [Trichoderma cornu-damae]|uniref:Uncharacterized protein n=1 Tax=Trichoderma cornu-damae TaxID=654480 RepID=A0A9P8QM91_9HYPO|nr:hypothetical protein Trco_004973 [Trichoderma cornu-damae]